MSSLSPAERYITGGAALVFGAYVIGDLIIEDHPVRDLAWVLAAAALVGVYFRHRSKAGPPSWYPGLLLLSGFGVALVAVDQLISDIRQGLGNNLGAVLSVVLYVGAAAMAWGAYLTGRALSRYPS